MLEAKHLVDKFDLKPFSEAAPARFYEVNPELAEEAVGELKKRGFVFLSGARQEAETLLCSFVSIDSGEVFGLALKSSQSFDLSKYYENALCLSGEAKRGPDVWAERERRRASVEASVVDERVRETFYLSGFLNPAGEIGVRVASENLEVRECDFRARFPGSAKPARTGMAPLSLLASRFLKIESEEGFAWSCLLHRALEEGNGIEIPDKAKAIRMVFLEFSRVMSHLRFVASIARQLEARSCLRDMLEGAAVIEHLRSLYSGNWMNAGVTTFGGVNRQPPVNWISSCLKELALFQTKLVRVAENLAKSALWRQTSRVGKTEGPQMAAAGISGPDLRAAGVNFDLRKRAPFYLYGEVEFATPVGLEGALFDRLEVRLFEAVESLGIVIQLLDNLPPGELAAREANHFSRLDPAKDMDQYIQSARNEWKDCRDGLYHSVAEGAGGLLNLFVRVSGALAENYNCEGGDAGKAAFLEKLAQGAPRESCELLLKSVPFNHRHLELIK